MLRHRSSTRLLLAVAFVAPFAWMGAARAQNPDQPAQPAAPPTASAAPSATTTAEPPAPPPSAPPSAPAPEPPPAREPLTTGGAPTTITVNPAGDQQQLQQQGQQRPADNAMNPVQSSDVFSDDWWGRARPILELHGYFRTRSEIFHNFNLGRHNTPQDAQHLWPQPL